jgi:propanol-preferring alcohol dehydrogenase
MAATMRAWVVDRPGPMSTGPLRAADLPVPEPGPGEIRVRVRTCGVCRTDLHLAEGDLAPRRPRTVPGHEAVGVVDALGPDSRRFRIGDRVGVAWLRSTCGTCRYCLAGRENLCDRPTFTGWDADGGYAPWVVVPEAYAHALPAGLDDLHAAPLLCAGIIGWRALKRASLPPGGRLGIYGYGASAHLTAQVARAAGATVHVFTRDVSAQRLALRQGAATAQGAADPTPEPLDSAILFAPVGTLVPPALLALAPGGTLAIAGIHLSDVPPLVYADHLFHEKQVVSVTANTRADAREFLDVAAAIGLTPTVQEYPFDAADRALADLAGDRVTGAAVLRMPG